MTVAVDQSIDWSSLKTAAIALGNVQEAARRAGENLPPDEQQRFIERVNKRSQREQWMNEAKAIVSSQLAPNAKPLSSPVQKGAETLNSHLLQAKNRTRFNLAKYVLNGSKVAARSRSPLADAGKVKDLASVMQKVWPEEKGSSNGINLSILSIGGDMAVQVKQGE